MSRGRTVRCVVSGRVQGVYYRAATCERATELGLRGWVRNLPDRRVEVVAAGDVDAVGALTAWLWQGPPVARVATVGVEEWTGAVPDDFSIR
ncbi:MAG TPA: acylphosphatase [Gammaproteobacteria bacterium]